MRRNGILQRFAILAAALIFLGVPAEAYYHYVYYSRSTPSFPIQARFDLNRLSNNTLVVTVADSGPSIYYPNDSFGSVLAEVKQALAVWNSVQSSSLRVAFGGLQPAAQNANTPGAEIVFQNLGPGLLGLTTVSVPANPSLSGSTVAISHSQVTLTSNTSLQPGPSYDEGFYTTVVHEVGHALGLQHTWTAAAMSQGTIRNTSRTRPIDADDMAGLSVLYPAPNWLSNLGILSGRVTYSTGQPVVLGSVVAIPNNGPAVSTLTNPDGSYTIFGLPPNTYQVYVHPLPPDAVSSGEGLQLPVNDAGQQVTASGSFRTAFYPGVQDPAQATQFSITPGSPATANFTVQQRTGVPTYNVVTESFLDPATRTYPFQASQPSYLPVSPAVMDDTQSAAYIIALTNAGTPSIPTPQSVTLLGVGNANFTAFNYGGSPAIQMSFGLAPFMGVGPRHLVLNFGNDIYVLPDAVDLVQKGPPLVTGVNPNGDGTVTVNGSGLSLDSRVFFDGMPASGTFNSATNAMTVTPPSASGGQLSTVAVYNSDSQNSLMIQQNPPTYSYPASANPQIQNITPNVLLVGQFNGPVSTRVDINTTGTQFVDGQVSVGFGSSDVTVSRVWVVSPTHLVANVVVAPGAATGVFAASIVSGMQVIEQPGALLLQPSIGGPQIASVVNGVSNQPGVLFPGSYGVIYGLNLGQAVGNIQLTVNGVAATVLFAAPTQNQVNFLAPAGLPVGPANLTFNNGSSIVTVAVQVANPGPTINGVFGGSAGSAANPGDVLTVSLSGLDSGVIANPARLQVTLAGLPMTVTQISAGQVQFVVTQSFGGTQVPVVVSVDGAASAPFLTTVR